MAIRRLVYQKTAQFCKVLSKIILMNQSSKYVFHMCYLLFLFINYFGKFHFCAVIQTYDSIMCGNFCIGFIDFMLKSKGLLDYTNLFSPNNYENSYKIILTYFQ